MSVTEHYDSMLSKVQKLSSYEKETLLMDIILDIYSSHVFGMNYTSEMLNKVVDRYLGTQNKEIKDMEDSINETNQTA